MNKKLRVGFVSVDDATAESTWSGTPLNILKALRKNPEVEVELISPLKTAWKWLFLPFKVREKWEKKYFMWYLQPSSLEYFARQIEDASHRLKLDVVFSTSSIPITRVDPSIPCVFWTDAVWQGMEGYYPGLFSNLCEKTKKSGRAQEAAGISRARFCCYSSEWAASWARRLASPQKVKVLPYGPNLQISHGRDQVLQWIHERRAKHPVCRLVFVGKNWQRKGGDIAIDTARFLNEHEIPTSIRIVGCEPSLPPLPFVEVIGLVDKNTSEGARHLAEIYKTSDILILPSRAEAFGIVAAEAAAFGLPSLVCHTGGLVECVRNGVTGFCVDLNGGAEQFAEGAKNILARYEDFAVAAFDEFNSRLNIETSVSQLVEILDAAASVGYEA